jgi:ferredoxin
MDFDSFVEGPLLKMVFLIFCLGIFARLACFVFSIIQSRKTIAGRGGQIFTIFLRFLVPFHRAVPKKPLYALLRYLFHIGLFVIPIWLAGHISLWEESSLEWSWASLPEGVADGMTIVMMVLALFFLLRRMFHSEARQSSSPLDYLVICLAGLPFFTGYFLTHGTLESVPFFGEKMWVIHILSGEAMVLMAVSLFCRTKLNPSRCTGCASCELACPTGTLEYQDKGILRIFHYGHYACICCASCVNTCPENAAELRHEISLKKIFQLFVKTEIRTVEMEACRRCGALFVPEPLLEKIEKSFAYDYLNFCSDCRKVNRGDYLKQLSPWHHKRKAADETLKGAH